MDTALEGLSRRERALRYYSGSLIESEKLLREEVYDLDGLDHEIAALRMMLRRALVREPENLKLITTGMGMLTRMVAAKYRMSPKMHRDLADSMAAVLNSLGDLLLPPDA